jgi:glycosyltransferase involved in cell wall biosynthesis
MRKTRKLRANRKKGGSQNKNTKFTISVGILTYFAPKTLRHTLETYKITGFIDCIDDLFVIIQKSDRQEEEKRVCEDYNVRYILMAENGNIAWGFKAIYENARNDIILFLENDFIIDTNTPKHIIEDFLANSLDFLLKINAIS